MLLHGLGVWPFVVRESEAFVVGLFVEIGGFLDDRLEVLILFILALELFLDAVHPLLFNGAEGVSRVRPHSSSSFFQLFLVGSGAYLLVVAVIGLVKLGQKRSYFGIVFVVLYVNKGQLLKVVRGFSNRSSSFSSGNKQQILLLQREVVPDLQEKMDALQRCI